MSLDEHLFNLRFAAKGLDRDAKKCEKEEKKEKNKLKLAIQKGNTEIARIHAENAIRKKNEGLNYLRMSARIDAVAARVQTAATQKRVTQSMSGVVKAMESAMRSMNLEKVQDLFNRFETEFENLDVHSSVMEGSMNSAMTLNAPEDQINALIKQVADENGLAVAAALPSAVDTSVGEKQRQQEDQLSQRLAALRE